MKFTGNSEVRVLQVNLPWRQHSTLANFYGTGSSDCICFLHVTKASIIFLNHFPLKNRGFQYTTLMQHSFGSVDVQIQCFKSIMIQIIPLFTDTFWLCISVSSPGFSQSGVGGTLGSSLPPFQTSMSSTLGQTGMGPAMDTQKGSGLFGVDNKTPTSTSGSSTVKNFDEVSTGGPGIHTLDHSAGIMSCRPVFQHCCFLNDLKVQNVDKKRTQSKRKLNNTRLFSSWCAIIKTSQVT